MKLINHPLDKLQHEHFSSSPFLKWYPFCIFQAVAWFFCSSWPGSDLGNIGRTSCKYFITFRYIFYFTLWWQSTPSHKWQFLHHFTSQNQATYDKLKRLLGKSHRKLVKNIRGLDGHTSELRSVELPKDKIGIPTEQPVFL